MAEEAECCSGELDSLFVSERELHLWLHTIWLFCFQAFNNSSRGEVFPLTPVISMAAEG